MPHPEHERAELVGLCTVSFWIERSLSHTESAPCRPGSTSLSVIALLLAHERRPADVVGNLAATVAIRWVPSRA